MFIKVVTIIVMLIILGSLASGIIFLVKDDGKSKRTVKALTIRIGLSVTLFILLILCFAFGLITPHPI